MGRSTTFFKLVFSSEKQGIAQLGLHPREGPNIRRGAKSWLILLAETSCVLCWFCLSATARMGGSRVCGSRGGGCVVTRGGWNHLRQSVSAGQRTRAHVRTFDLTSILWGAGYVQGSWHARPAGCLVLSWGGNSSVKAWWEGCCQQRRWLTRSTFKQSKQKPSLQSEMF